jgi:hypothetical protein
MVIMTINSMNKNKNHNKLMLSSLCNTLSPSHNQNSGSFLWNFFPISNTLKCQHKKKKRSFDARTNFNLIDFFFIMNIDNMYSVFIICKLSIFELLLIMMMVNTIKL